MKRKSAIIVTSLFVLSIGLQIGGIIQNEKEKTALKNDLAFQYELYTTEQSDHEGTLSALQEAEKQIDKLHTSLEIALTETALIQTILNTKMETWTVDEILMARSQLASLPYGSPFKGGHFVTAPFGSRELTGTYWKKGHPGIDIYPLSGNEREPVLSVMDGRVVTWGRNDRVYGNYLLIESLDGSKQIFFAHLSAIGVILPNGSADLAEGMEFTAGTQLARMGATGQVTGTHLHMEYRLQEIDGSYRVLNATAITDFIGEIK